MKILVVDDEKGIQRLFQQRFRRETRNGMVELHFAFSGEEALQFLSTGGAKDLTVYPYHGQVPLLMNSHVLVKVSPARRMVPSGMVTSRRSTALSLQFGSMVTAKVGVRVMAGVAEGVGET